MVSLPRPSPQYDATNESQTRSLLERALDQFLQNTNFTFGNLKAKPTTLSGYGITDALAASVLPLAGVTDGSNATAGKIGEYIASTVPGSLPVTLTTNVPVNVTHIDLTPGDWDVRGGISATGGSSTLVAYLVGSISDTSVLIESSPARRGDQFYNSIALLAAIGPHFSCGFERFSITANTRIYLVAQAGFNTSSMAAYGYIAARRVR